MKKILMCVACFFLLFGLTPIYASDITTTASPEETISENISNINETINTIVTAVVVSLGGTGGLIALFSSLLRKKTSILQAKVDEAVSQNQISLKTADGLKELLTDFMEFTEKKLNGMEEKVQQLIDQNVDINERTEDLINEIQDYRELIASVFVDVFGDEPNESEE